VDDARQRYPLTKPCVTSGCTNGERAFNAFKPKSLRSKISHLFHSDFLTSATYQGLTGSWRTCGAVRAGLSTGNDLCQSSPHDVAFKAIDETNTKLGSGRQGGGGWGTPLKKRSPPELSLLNGHPNEESSLGLAVPLFENNWAGIAAVLRHVIWRTEPLSLIQPSCDEWAKDWQKAVRLWAVTPKPVKTPLIRSPYCAQIWRTNAKQWGAIANVSGRPMRWGNLR